MYYLMTEVANVKSVSEIMLRNTENFGQGLSKCPHPVLLTTIDTVRETRLQTLSGEL